MFIANHTTFLPVYSFSYSKSFSLFSLLVNGKPQMSILHRHLTKIYSFKLCPTDHPTIYSSVFEARQSFLFVSLAGNLLFTCKETKKKIHELDTTHNNKHSIEKRNCFWFSFKNIFKLKNKKTE